MTIDELLDAAVAAAPVYAAVDGERRAEFLRSIAAELESEAQDIVSAADSETHLGETRLRAELARTTGQLRLFADLIADGSWQGARIDTGPPDIRRMLIPLGPVAVFGASNFPLAFSVPGGDTASALAAGCPVVCKAHPAHPHTSVLAADAIGRAADASTMPPGVFALVEDSSVEAGQRLVADDRIEAVAFTGSLAAGRTLYDIATRRSRPIPVYAEMGSINPVFVLPGAAAQRGDEIAEELANSITLGYGQFCTKPGVIVAVQGTIRNALAKAIATRPAGPMLTPSIAEQYVRRLHEVLQAGPTLVVGAPEPGQPVLANVDADTYLARPETHHEVFGPASLLVEATDNATFEAIADFLDGQLTATVYGTETELAERGDLLATLSRRAGRVIANGVPTGVTVTHAMQHGGPYPASTDPRTTSVGTAAIERFVRPVCYQNLPNSALPPLLRNSNPLQVVRLINGHTTREPIR